MSARFVRQLVAFAALFALPSALAQVRSKSSQPPTKPGVDAAFQKFWAAGSVAEAAQLAGDVEKTGVTFDDALRRLKLGRTYTAQTTGVIQMENRTEDGVEFFYSVNIPSTYDPARRYQVRVQLHGGVDGRADNQPRGNGEIGTLAGAEQIYVLPYAWIDEPWWNIDQVFNLNIILDSLKRAYNIDENRVVVSGTSDGGTGAYYIAMRDTTPFASFLPLNGNLLVLGNDNVNDGFIFLNNLRDKPMFVVNGGRDPLYPPEQIEPVMQHLLRAGADIAYHPQPDGEHNTRWWPEVQDTFEKFVADHPRNPHPDKLTWQAADPFTSRAHWLVIDEFGNVPGEASDLPDLNVVNPSEPRVIHEGGGPLLLRRPFGRVDLVRNGNTVQAQTMGVAAFTLLLSPDTFDFRRPIKVIANGREVFNARVERSVKTLLKWAALDNDRTMLYAAELKINLTH